MRLALAIFIYFVTVYQPAIAVIGVTADEDVRPVPYDNRHEQSGTAVPDSKAKVLSEVTRGLVVNGFHRAFDHE